MNRSLLITSIVLFIASGAFAQSDDEVLEAFRTSLTEIFLEQAPWALPESFHKSELSQSDKERIILQLANDTANCLADAAVEYAALKDLPLSDLISSDSTIHLEGESGKEFSQLLDPCISHAWEASGIKYE